MREILLGVVGGILGKTFCSKKDTQSMSLEGVTSSRYQYWSFPTVVPFTRRTALILHRQDTTEKNPRTWRLKQTPGQQRLKRTPLDRRKEWIHSDQITHPTSWHNATPTRPQKAMASPVGKESPRWTSSSSSIKGCFLGGPLRSCFTEITGEIYGT